MALADDLVVARSAIADPDAWRREVILEGSVADSRCAPVHDVIGALDFIEDTIPAMKRNAARMALMKHLPSGVKSLSQFCQSSAVTHADVMALFDRAMRRVRVDEEGKESPAEGAIG